eukprot:12797325-Prorocentrum_lima.AAC.1
MRRGCLAAPDQRSVRAAKGTGSGLLIPRRNEGVRDGGPLGIAWTSHQATVPAPSGGLPCRPIPGSQAHQLGWFHRAANPSLSLIHI